MTKDFIPKTDSDLATYLSNFQIEVSVVGPAVGLSADEITAFSAACTDTSTKIRAVTIKKNESLQSTTEKQSSKKSTIALIRKFARCITAHPSYDAAKDQLQNTIEKNKARKGISLYWATIIPVGILIDFFPKFHCEGVNVYRKRGDETSFLKIAFVKVSPYIDTERLLLAGHSEKREYYVVGVINYEETDEASDVVTVVVGD